MLRVFLYSLRCALASSSPSGVDCNATQTTDTCGLPSGLMVTSVASAPAPISTRAESSSFTISCTASARDSFPFGARQGVERGDELGFGAVLVEAQGMQRAVVAFGFEEGEQDVLRADVVVPQAKCLAEGQLENLPGGSAEGHQGRYLGRPWRKGRRGACSLGVDPVCGEEAGGQ